MGHVMDGWGRRSFTAPLASGDTVTHDVYSRGQGPVVVIIQELPGIGPETLRLAGTFEAAGFTVVLPHLFGPLGRVSMLGNTVRVFCLRREFTIFRKGGTSPIVNWLAALCHDLKASHEVPGVGVIGMCLTGNFAISLMADDAVLAGVASQPSLPIGKHEDLHMAEGEVQAARAALTEKGPMIALRFEGDPLCRGTKFAAIDAAFNDADAERVRLRVMPGKGHSVLTLDFVDEAGHPTRAALDEVLGYFGTALGAGRAADA